MLDPCGPEFGLNELLREGERHFRHVVIVIIANLPGGEGRRPTERALAEPGWRRLPQHIARVELHRLREPGRLLTIQIDALVPGNLRSIDSGRNAILGMGEVATGFL